MKFREGSLPALVFDDYKARWRGPGVGLPRVVFHNIIVTATCGGGSRGLLSYFGPGLRYTCTITTWIRLMHLM